MINQDTLDFLAELKRHNDRDWFKEHRDWYERSLDNFKIFIQEIRIRLDGVDSIEKTKIYRIYRDIRFSKDKTPYKTHFAANFKRAGKIRRGGFYVQISPEKVIVAGGFWGPNKDDLRFMREGIMADASNFRQALGDKEVKKRFGQLKGDELKTAPRGYDRDHPDMDLIRKKQYLLVREYNGVKALDKDFHIQVARDLEAMIPVFDVLTEYLVYDGNGVERN